MARKATIPEGQSLKKRTILVTEHLELRISETAIEDGREFSAQARDLIRRGLEDREKSR